VSVRLSICIATFNRGAFIGETLASIAREAVEGLEVVVLDGGSKDDTAEVVRRAQERMSYLHYYRQATNAGVDRDFDTAVERATGEYCWLMSDDDLFMPGAVTAVLRALENDPSLVIVNSEVRSVDLSQRLDASRLQFTEDRRYSATEHDRLFDETSGYLTYIAAVVIRRSVWLDRDRASYYGSNFIHVGVIFQAPLPHGAVALAQPLISVRFGNTTWRPKEFEIRMIRWTELIASLSAVSELVRRRRYPAQPWRSLKSLMFYRAKGTYSLTEYRRWIAPRLPWGAHRMQALAVALFPGVIANWIGLLYCRLPYRDSNLHLLDMKISRFNLWNRAGIERTRQ
jgi:glycosyltransferase involved in cell wall biosynthesis